MTPGQLIDLLEKSGMLKEESPGVLGWHPTMQKAQACAALVASAEREACAALLDENAMACTSPIYRSLLQANAAAIRARGDV